MVGGLESHARSKIEAVAWKWRRRSPRLWSRAEKFLVAGHVLTVVGAITAFAFSGEGGVPPWATISIGAIAALFLTVHAVHTSSTGAPPLTREFVDRVRDAEKLRELEGKGVKFYWDEAAGDNGVQVDMLSLLGVLSPDLATEFPKLLEQDELEYQARLSRDPIGRAVLFGQRVWHRVRPVAPDDGIRATLVFSRPRRSHHKTDNPSTADPPTEPSSNADS